MDMILAHRSEFISYIIFLPWRKDSQSTSHLLDDFFILIRKMIRIRIRTVAMPAAGGRTRNKIKFTKACTPVLHSELATTTGQSRLTVDSSP